MSLSLALVRCSRLTGRPCQLERLLQLGHSRAQAARLFICTPERVPSNVGKRQTACHSINELWLKFHGQRDHETSRNRSSILTPPSLICFSVGRWSSLSYFTGSTSGSALPCSTWLSDGMTMGVGGVLAHEARRVRESRAARRMEISKG